MNPKKDKPMGGLAAMALVGQLGLGTALPIVAGVLGGVYLDNRVGGRGVVLAGMVLLGIAGGAAVAYRSVSRHLG